MSVERKRFECSALPKGWQREEVVRKAGPSAGKVDVYYYSPEGKRFGSKNEVARYFGQEVDVNAFDFSKPKTQKEKTRRAGYGNQVKENKSRSKKRKQRNKSRSPVDLTSRGGRSDASLVPPIRQTASIFKQPVTVIKQMEGKVKAEFKHGGQEKPKQLFWEKRLEGMRPCDTEGLELHAMELPKGLKAVGPHVTEETILQSVATALHVSNQPITGQTGSKTALEKNPGVFINPDQPLVQAVAVGEDDIKRQEERVGLARKKLEEALKNLKQ